MSLVGPGAELRRNLGTYADPVWFDPRPRRSAASPDAGALLAAIRAHPLEDAPRFAYADWLEEHGEDDLDRATAEFVRCSCRGARSGSIQLRSAYPWLEANWRRLVPRFAAELTARNVAAWRRGSEIIAEIVPRGESLPVAVSTKFRRGFMQLCSIHVVTDERLTPSARVLGAALWALLAADQPLATIERGGSMSLVRGGEQIGMSLLEFPA